MQAHPHQVPGQQPAEPVRVPPVSPGGTCRVRSQGERVPVWERMPVSFLQEVQAFFSGPSFRPPLISLRVFYQGLSPVQQDLVQ